MKHWILVAFAMFAFARQPAKTPESQKASKSDSAQVADQADATKDQQKPTSSASSTAQAANPSIVPKDQLPTVTEDGQRTKSDDKAHEEDLKIQRQLVWFTGALVVVGFLQAGVMVLQWLMYRGQANEMRRQRHEMKRQREYMRLQWEAMGEQARLINDQLKEMQSAGKQTDKLIEQATRQAEQLTTVASAGRISAEAAAKAAEAAETSANSYQAAERAWITWTQTITDTFIDSTDVATGEKISGTMFRFQWINSGHTPAVNCSILTQGREVTDENSPVPTLTPPPNIQQLRVPIVPGVQVYGSRWPFRKEVMEALKKRKCRIFLYGRVDYETVYSTATSRHTEICIEVTYLGADGKTGGDLFNFSTVGPQNSAT